MRDFRGWKPLPQKIATVEPCAKVPLRHSRSDFSRESSFLNDGKCGYNLFFLGGVSSLANQILQIFLAIFRAKSHRIRA